MAVVGAKLYSDIKNIGDKLFDESLKDYDDPPNFQPDYSGTDRNEYFAGMLTKAINEALATYTDGEGNALNALTAATSACLSALGEMGSSPYAPLASALVPWFTVFQTYLAQMQAGPNAPDPWTFS